MTEYHTGAPEHMPTTRKMTPMQGPLEILQLFIPGLGKPHQKFGAFMKLLGTEPIRSG
jgi:hypothetical protein